MGLHIPPTYPKALYELGVLGAVAATFEGNVLSVKAEDLRRGLYDVQGLACPFEAVA